MESGYHLVLDNSIEPTAFKIIGDCLISYLIPFSQLLIFLLSIAVDIFG